MNKRRKRVYKGETNGLGRGDRGFERGDKRFRKGRQRV
jgi:hypothetical protein